MEEALVQSIRDIVGTTATLKQGELRTQVVVQEVTLRVGVPGAEELKLRVETVDDTEQVLHLEPSDVTIASYVEPLDDFVAHTSITIVWDERVPQQLLSPPRPRRSPLAQR